jgi:RND family efflux transporter MFP subunit
MSKLKSNIVSFFFLFAVTASFTSCKNKQKASEVKSVAVTLEKISYDNSTYTEEYIGTVESKNTVDVSFLTMGTIERTYTGEGQMVSKGQLLANLNIASLKSTYDLTVATLKQAEDAYKRMTAMYESKSLPEIQYVDYRTKLEQAKASQAIALKNLKDGNLYAPQSGTISLKYLEPGASVMPGTPVYQIMDISSVKIKVAIPENEISSISVNSACKLKVSALGNQSFNGVVVEKGVAANPISHTYDIKVKVDNNVGKLKPGMVCKAYVDNASVGSQHKIIVPLKSIQVDYSGKRFVWLKGKDNKAVYKEITLGKLKGNGVVVENGLSEGDELITEGYQNISKGVSLTVKNAIR